MRQQNIVLGLLSAVAGGMDAMSFLAFGVFTSAMSGNAILFGLALGQGKLVAASGSLLAFAGYVVGVAAATPLGLSAAPPSGSGALRRTLIAEMVLLAAFTALWPAHLDAARLPTIQRALILLAGAAMGLQAAVARQANAPGITTVVFTSTLTAAVTALTNAAFGRIPRHIQPQTWRQIVMFLLYLASAAGMGALASQAPALAAVPPFACVALALVLV